MGYRTGEKYPAKLQWLKLCVVDSSQPNGTGAEQCQPNHSCNSHQQKPAIAPIFKCFLLCHRNKWDGTDGQPQKERTHEIDILLKQTGQQHHTAYHANAPADTQFQQVRQGSFSLLPIAPKQPVERIDKAIVKAQNEGDRSPGHAGNAIGQCHAKAMKCG